MKKRVKLNRKSIDKIKKDIKEEIGVSKYEDVKKNTCFKDYEGI